MRSLRPWVTYPFTAMSMALMHSASSTPIQFSKEFHGTKIIWSLYPKCFDKLRWTPRPVGGASSFSISSRSSSSIPAHINSNTNDGEGAGKDKLSMRIGFLGLGIMGSPMAHNLIKAGCDVTVWNRTTSKCESLLNIGAKYVFWKQTKYFYRDMDHPPRMLHRHVMSPFPCLLILGVQWKSLVESKGLFMDWVLEKGDKSLYHEVAPLLDIMGKSRFYLGDVGNGAAMKLVVNMIMGSMMASFSEGLILGEKLGLDPSVLVEVISQGAISAPMFSMKGPSMVKASYATAFPLKHQQKDLRLALAMAEEVSQPTPVAAAANELYKVAKAHGLGEEDFSAVIEALKGDLRKN